ncbi:MBL fold metallo-hydrolase [Gemmatimonadetes bacterium T265]|nr:MBL fold metallo-hydrolase [Gemmatimonadetes bacterium T265]
MRLWVLGTGSRGNAVLLESDGARLLVDAGFGVRALAERLAAARVAPESIDACVVTHEHADHVKGVRHAAARWGWAIHASAGTAGAHAPLRAGNASTFAAGAGFRVGPFDVQTVATPHDAAESVAVVVTSDSGARAGVCYDLGHAPDPVRAALAELDVLVLEANHDEAMLRAGPYPPSVAERIAGRFGHLSNRAAGALARQIAGAGLRHVVLAHLSESCNEPRLASADVGAALARTRFRGAITPALQDLVAGPFVATAHKRSGGAEQLALGL